LGVPPPCKGGVIALNGTTGGIVWRYWTNDTIFALQCSADLNGDGLEDCLAIGEEGSLVALDSKNGSLIWQQNNHKLDVFVANFIPDQNNDSVPDILSSHTSLDCTYNIFESTLMNYIIISKL
jgi:glucose dehydrogenase